MNALVYAPNWLGDAVMAMPALQVWRERHPGARVTVLTRAGNAPLWRMHPAVDEVVCLAPGTRGTFRTGFSLRGRGFDTAYLLPNSFRSALVAFLAGIPRRRGFGRHARTLLLTSVARPSTAPGDYHQSRETAPILLEDGIPENLPAPDLRVPEELREATLRKFMVSVLGAARSTPPCPSGASPLSEGGSSPVLPPSERGVAAEPPGGVFRATDKPTPPLISIIPGAARGDSKRWPHFAEAGRLLAAANPALRFAILGTQAEDGLCKQVADAIGANRAVNAAGRTSLPEFAALLAASSAVLCNDSGGMHLAAAVGAPVVAVFGLTDWRRTGPLGDKVAIVRRDDVEGRRAIARESREAAAVLASIPAERVVSAALSLMD